MRKRLLPALLALCAALALLPGTAEAVTPPTTGVCGPGVIWQYDNVRQALTISGAGPIDDYSGSREAPWYGHSSSIRSVIIRDGVTGIGDYAFCWHSNLTSVEIPGSVVRIGNCAFWDCYELANVTIPNGVATIGRNAFLQCSRALTGVTIPSSVTFIGDGAFGLCGSLAEIKVESGNTAYVSDGGVLMDARRTTILTYPAKKSGVTYRVPDSVTTIGPRAFSRCENLVGIIIPETVASIGSEAFSDCTGLTGIKLPGGITEIASNLFYNCSSLKSVVIPASVTQLGYQAFYMCDSLTDIYFAGSEAEKKFSIIAGSGNEAAARAAWHYNSTGPESGLTVIFDPNGGSLAGSLTRTTDSSGRLSSLPAPTRAGYTFDGWYTGPEGGSRITESTVYTKDNTVVYAHWKAAARTVTFNPNGGSLTGGTTRTTDSSGRLSSLPAPTRGGYTFDGWYTAAVGGEKVTTSTVFTKDTTVYAHWTYAGGGSPEPEPEPEKKAELISPPGSPAVIQLTGVSVPDGARVFAARLAAGGRFAGAAPGTFSGSRITFNSALAGGDKLLFLSGDFVPLGPAVKITG